MLFFGLLHATKYFCDHFEKRGCSFCVCMGMSLCICTYKFMDALVPGCLSWRLDVECFSSWPYYLSQDLSLNLMLTIQLDWLASKPQGSSCLCFSRLGLQACVSVPGYLAWVLRLELGYPCLHGRDYTNCIIFPGLE